MYSTFRLYVPQAKQVLQYWKGLEALDAKDMVMREVVFNTTTYDIFTSTTSTVVQEGIWRAYHNNYVESHDNLKHI